MLFTIVKQYNWYSTVKSCKGRMWFSYFQNLSSSSLLLLLLLMISSLYRGQRGLTDYWFAPTTISVGLYGISITAGVGVTAASTPRWARTERYTIARLNCNTDIIYHAKKQIIFSLHFEKYSLGRKLFQMHFTDLNVINILCSVLYICTEAYERR
jgi:hypothetical protein